jgi:hypothetical protein
VLICARGSTPTGHPRSIVAPALLRSESVFVVQGADIGCDRGDRIVEDIADPKILETCVTWRGHTPCPGLRVIAVGATEHVEGQRKVARTSSEWAGHREIPSDDPGTRPRGPAGIRRG